MAQGTFTLNGTSTQQIVAADTNRVFLTIQSKGSTSFELGIGTAAVAGQGIKLINPGDSAQIKGALAKLAVNAIGTATTSNGGYQDGDIQVSPVYAA